MWVQPWPRTAFLRWIFIVSLCPQCLRSRWLGSRGRLRTQLLLRCLPLFLCSSIQYVLAITSLHGDFKCGRDACYQNRLAPDPAIFFAGQVEESLLHPRVKVNDMIPRDFMSGFKHWVHSGHNIFCQSTDWTYLASKQFSVSDRHLISPKLQDRGHPNPGFRALLPDISSSFGQMVRFVRDFSPTLPGPGKLVKQIMGKYGYRVVEPGIHILPAPIYDCNDFKCKALCVLTEMPEGIDLLHIPLWV